MTHDEIFAHLGTLPALDGWLWLYAQTPAVQTMALQNMVALGAQAAGMDGDAAWSHALQAVPEDGHPWFPGADPHEEWIAALATLNAAGDEDADAAAWDAWVDEMARPSFAAAFQGGAGSLAGGIGYSVDVTPTLMSQGGSNQVPLVVYEDE